GWTVTVPGAVASWVAVLERFGTRSLRELLAPAIDLAEQGFFVSRYLHAALRAAEGILRRSEQGREWFLARGVPPVYSRLRQPALARCLRLLADTNGDALYHGEIAAAIASALARSGGFVDEHDLASHGTRFDTPLTLQLDGLELLAPPPNSQGIVLLEALRLAEARTGEPFPDVEDADRLH